MLIKEAESRLPSLHSERYLWYLFMFINFILHNSIIHICKIYSSGSSGLSVTQDLKPKMVKMFQSSNIAKQTMFWKKNNQNQ